MTTAHCLSTRCPFLVKGQKYGCTYHGDRPRVQVRHLKECPLTYS